jgi:pimeloyl-ACP methyl ester carboxylesterase
LAVDLASHGYLVAGVTPTDSANLTVLDGRPVHASGRGNPQGFSGGHTPAATRTGERLLRVWAHDARFAADRVGALGRNGRFARHVDATRVAYVGHSFGGASALEACRLDPRCVAASDLDGAEYGPVVRGGLKVPLLLVGHQGSCVAALCAPANDADRTDLAVARSLVSHSRGHAWSIGIDGTQHFAFTDYAGYYLALPLRRLLPLGSLDGDRALRATGDSLTRFLAAALDHARPIRFTSPDGHPEVHLRAW